MSMKNCLMPIAFFSCAPGLDSKVMAGAGAQAHPAHKAVLMSNVERVQGFVPSTAVLVRRLRDIEVHPQADDARGGRAVEDTAVEHNLFTTKEVSK